MSVGRGLCRGAARWLGSGLAFAMLFGGAGAAPSDPEPTSKTAQRWGVPPEFIEETPDVIELAWAKRQTGYLATRDGVALRYSVLLPKGTGPFPVILNYSGYDPGSIGGYAYRHNDTAMATALDQALLDRGFAVLGVNARGTGCSEGVFDFLGPTYGTDGADIVEWAAKEPWSTGAVGMANWSWAGMSQVATASERPPHLKAIAPGMALTDPHLDSWALGGVPSEGFVTGWWMYLHSRWLAVRRSAEDEHDARCLVQVERNYQGAQNPQVNLPANLIRHPLRDDWMQQHTLLDHAERIEVPVLSMEAFQDEATTVRAGYYQERLSPDRLWMVQTNGNHDLYESLQFRATLLDFFDHFLKGHDNGFERRPHVEIWQETTSSGKGSRHQHDLLAKAGWIITRPTLPVPVQTLSLTLAAAHRLNLPDVTSATAADPDQYEYPIEGPSVDLDPYAPAWGELATRWAKGSVQYTTAPLAKDVLIYGPASADLWISSTQSDTDVQVTLTDVRADGQEMFVQRGWLRLSDRKLEATYSTPTRPWLCDRPGCIESLVPDVPVLARIEIFKVAHAFRRGSRIRLWIDAPSATGGNAFDHSSLAATNAVWHDAVHPSKLVLNILDEVGVPERAAECGAVLMQPCRRDPLAAAAATANP